MLIPILQFSGGVLLLYLGGSSLVRGSAALAGRLGVPPLVAGLTIVAFGTSTPELAVTLDAAIEGYDDIAVGNVVGSNTCNIALILGLCALISPIRLDPRLFRFDIPIMLGCSALLVGMLWDDRLTRIEGALLVLGILAYVFRHLRVALRQRGDWGDVEPASACSERPRAAPHVLFVIAGLVGLMAGGYLAVHAGVQLASSFGVSNAVIALTVVAVGTSLPELSTSLIAAFRSHDDLAVGNVIGSNIFNILAILGLTACIRPLVRGDIGWIDLAVMCGVSILIVPLAWSGLRLGRREGALLLVCYGGYSWWSFAA